MCIRDRRDGEWKIVSFQSQPWELYQMSTDRTELNDLAIQHPDILSRMVKQWHDLTANVLLSTGKDNQPVSTKVIPKTHIGWTDYTAPLSAGKIRGKGKQSTVKTESTSGTLPRARAGTKLKIEGKQLVLTCSSKDPGLAFDKLGVSAPGPYTLTFRVQSKASGEGKFLWTTDAATILPKGKLQPFSVTHDGQWQDISLTIAETKTLFGMRLDPCAGEGEVRIEALQLKDAKGMVLKSWP